ncbi:bifunctional diguanylate cyclase/phosphodiesterase [Vibrio sinaloensis]|nr:bifunctional diguanylate cyclase/phosphodiesterase [Vibrio sinaloensis]MCZ4293279.1 bifunctional diguanylate cyclase/phosphodiesterase [Vibrio sinaloensis]
MKLALSYKHVILIWLLGTILAVLSYFTVHQYETQKIHAQLEAQLTNRIQTLSQSLKSVESLIYSTRAFISNSNRPSAKQFESYFTEQVHTNLSVGSVMWAPAVKLDQIADFERQAQRDGFLGFKITPALGEADSDIWFLDQTTLPVLYLSSWFEGSDQLGVRLESDPNNVSAMSRAITTGRIGVSDFTQNGQANVRLLLPKFSDNGNLEGFIVANLVLHELLGQIWHKEINSSTTKIQAHIEPSQQLIFESHINTELESDGITTRLAQATRVTRIPLFNQYWQVSITSLDRTGSTARYGLTLIILIFLLTCSATIAANFYATRLKVSDRVIEEKTRSLADQAIKDNLTNLKNRNALDHEVAAQLNLMSRGESVGFSILFIDLDRFKVINDSMGHLHGDKLLKQVGSRLTEHCRSNDMGFRFGGDEFVICLPGLISRSALSHICQRYSNVLSRPYTIDGQSCHIGASIGISIVTDPNQTLAGILREADTAMYRAKSSSHEKVVFFHEKMFSQAKMRFTLEQELTSALALKQLSLVYQPIYCADSDKVTGFESLLRWNHPKLGQVSPAEFIPIAEETGMIIKIGDWVANECCKTLNRLWHSRKEHDVPRININVSAKQFESEHIYHTLVQLLDQYDFPAHLVGIEITESMLLREECSAHQLQRIKALGVTLYLDDFGTGYSSLSVLNEYPVDVLKVDRSFVSRLALGQSNADNLCRAIISMAHTIDLEVVAEGVETPEQLAILRQHHCNYVQGYLKSKPLTVCKIEQVLNHKQQLSA